MDAPDWFRSALAVVESATVPMDGVPIDALSWGPPLPLIDRIGAVLDRWSHQA
ncbi:MAG TPA: hypothetical protein VJ762_04350 [Sphingobium sp.]|nr:hypothetical protein [Sphingobium sp.]